MTNLRAALVAVNLLLLGPISSGAADVATATPTVNAAPTATTTAAESTASKTPSKENIVGVWKSVDDGELMDFRADGVARVGGGMATFIGTYKFLDDGSFVIDMPVFGKQSNFVYRIEMKDDQLILTLKDKQPRRYDRVK